MFIIPLLGIVAN